MTMHPPPGSLPVTVHVPAARAMATLGYVEMVALSDMFDRWAFTEPNVDDAARAKFIGWAQDFATIADHCGPEWMATSPEDPPDAIAFIAAKELETRRGTEG